MEITKNDVFEGLSCVLLMIMIGLSFTCEHEFLCTFMIVLSISIFCMITYFSFDGSERELGMIKCESMLFCLFLMIYLYYQINMLIPLGSLFILLCFTVYKEIKNR